MAFYMSEEKGTVFLNTPFVSLKYKFLKRSIQGYKRALPD